MSSTVIETETAQFPPRRGWTGEEFERLTELNFFGPEERLELVNGEIITQMTQNSPHATALRLTEKALNRIFRDGFDVRPQMPLNLGRDNRPEPDIAVVSGTPRDYAQEHPTTAVLAVEVSDTTLLFDQTEKQSIYAHAGIPEYWIINLKQRLLEVYRQPTAMSGVALGYGYQTILRLTENDTMSPLTLPSAVVAVADLLP